MAGTLHPLAIGQIETSRLATQLSYHNMYRQMKPVRVKYKLSCNELLTLNGLYIYSFLIDSSFTVNAALRFLTYYNNERMKFYICKLIEKGYIILHRTVGAIVYYRLTQEAIEVVTEMFDDYDKRQREFCEKFNIML